MPYQKRSLGVHFGVKTYAVLLKNGFTMREAQRLCDSGRVSCETGILAKADIANGEVWLVDYCSEPRGLEPIFECGDFAVFDKPSGVLSHPNGRRCEYSLCDEIWARWGEGACVAHRLDRETSGVIVAAKNKLAAKRLKLTFESRAVAKSYLALVEGRVDLARLADGVAAGGGLSNSNLGGLCENFGAGGGEVGGDLGAALRGDFIRAGGVVRRLTAQNVENLRAEFAGKISFFDEFLGAEMGEQNAPNSNLTNGETRAKTQPNSNLTNTKTANQTQSNSNLPHLASALAIPAAQDLGEFFVIDAPMRLTREYGDLKVRMVLAADGKRAVTLVRVVRRLAGATLVQCLTLTGRQHQIRLHLCGVGHRILGEPIYTLPRADIERILDKQVSQPERVRLCGASRLMLHAQRIKFEFGGRVFDISSKMDFLQDCGM